MSVECQVSIKSQSELDIGGSEIHYSRNLQDMSGFVVGVTVVVIVVSVVVVAVTDVVVVVEVENKGEMVSVKLTSVTIVSNVVDSDAGRSCSAVVIKSILSSFSLSCIVVTTAAVVIAPVTPKNIKMTLMKITAFLVFPDPS